MNPYRIAGPAVISCSFGRTSGYLLWQILNAHDGKLPHDVYVLFENTGKEQGETLDFGYEMGKRWGIPIIWLEYNRQYLPEYKSTERRLAAERARSFCGHIYEPANGRSELGFRYVNYETASRNGEPFHNLIDMMGLPNQNTRLCTSEMKIRVAKKWMRGAGFEHWDNVMGIRADEPRRVSRLKQDHSQRWENVLPLAEAGIVNDDVLDFWERQDFDLNLPVDETGSTVGGNCDLCHLKAQSKKIALMRARPGCADWWDEQEIRTGQTFRPHGETYARLRLRVLSPVACEVDDGLGDCFCTD